MKQIILGTAGHIDHGKTTLVKALTGVDTDRLAEEKARGITIDLGFAPLVIGDVAFSVVEVAATTGAGLDALRSELLAAAALVGERRETDLFRMPVDRVFALAGAGT